MSITVTATAQIQCTLGATPQKLVVTSQTFVKIKGGLVGTEGDKQAMINIPSFGSCKCSSNNPPCIPSPQNWQKTAEKEHINSKKILTKDSFCMCAKGGKISFIDTGKNTLVDCK